MTVDTDLLGILTGPAVRASPAAFRIEQAATTAELDAYRSLRHDVFVAEQGLFAGSDHDDVDDDPRTVVLLAVSPDGEVIGGVRLAPQGQGRDLGWWAGSRLVVAAGARRGPSVGPALVRAACARAETEGVLRFDACVQSANETMFARLGWERRHDTSLHGAPHVEMTWPVDRVARLVAQTKAELGLVLSSMPTGWLGGEGFVGDDGAPVPGSDLIAACDAILPSMVERDPEWAGWCSVLVNVNDLSAMGATPVALLDSVGARDASFARRVLSGVRDASQAWGVPVVGGHTQLGVPASLSVTALGRTDHPVRGGGGRAGQHLRVTADLGGDWRPGYGGQQWDSTSSRTGAELRHLAGHVARLRPSAAKDASMAGIVGTTGMLAEASGCGAVVDVADVPAPDTARLGDWLTCFPGFAMITAHDSTDVSGPTTDPRVHSRACGRLTDEPGVRLRWPDGHTTTAVPGTVTGMGTS
ncbi:MSMEG_0567/sll0787 family protein [Solicola sp. PLA-1-18]|uniref:MSMEG_0567/sll0787 family protein n=1 Tax=Solicola sp. PLA-1-18 TaxID=3380532 RepID=UPI003B7EE12A